MKSEQKWYLAAAAVFIFYCVLFLSFDSVPAFLITLILVWVLFMATLRLVKGFCERHTNPGK